eukprot:scaffold131303_cov36-Phaeocystis_antarctica.AAC.1
MSRRAAPPRRTGPTRAAACALVCSRAAATCRAAAAAAASSRPARSVGWGGACPPGPRDGLPAGGVLPAVEAAAAQVGGRLEVEQLEEDVDLRVEQVRELLGEEELLLPRGQPHGRARQLEGLAHHRQQEVLRLVRRRARPAGQRLAQVVARARVDHVHAQHGVADPRVVGQLVGPVDRERRQHPRDLLELLGRVEDGRAVEVREGVAVGHLGAAPQPRHRHDAGGRALQREDRARLGGRAGQRALPARGQGALPARPLGRPARHARRLGGPVGALGVRVVVVTAEWDPLPLRGTGSLLLLRVGTAPSSGRSQPLLDGGSLLAGRRRRRLLSGLVGILLGEPLEDEVALGLRTRRRPLVLALARHRGGLLSRGPSLLPPRLWLIAGAGRCSLLLGGTIGAAAAALPPRSTPACARVVGLCVGLTILCVAGYWRLTGPRPLTAGARTGRRCYR